MAMPTGNGENPQVYRQWTIDDPQNWQFANRLRRRRVYQHGFPGLSTSKNQGAVPLGAYERRKGASNCRTFVVPSSVEFSASKTRLISKLHVHTYFVKKPAGGHHQQQAARALGNPYRSHTSNFKAH